MTPRAAALMMIGPLSVNAQLSDHESAWSRPWATLAASRKTG
jgi:hypothetical protein